MSKALSALVFAIAALAPAPAQARAPEVVSVGVFTVAPYVMNGPNGPVGALIEFFDQEIAPRMGVRFQWERPMTTARLESSLASGRVMFTPIFIKTDARVGAGIHFAGEPYVQFDPCLAVLPDSPLRQIESPADLAPLMVGWVQGGALPPFMMDARIRLDRVGSVDWAAVNLDKLRLGRIDAAYFSNRYTPQYFAAQTGMRLKLIDLPTQGAPLYGAFSPQAPAGLAERYRRAAEEAFAGGRFTTYLNRALERKPAPAQ